jgi:hypothetical protein
LRKDGYIGGDRYAFKKDTAIYNNPFFHRQLLCTGDYRKKEPAKR